MDYNPKNLYRKLIKKKSKRLFKNRHDAFEFLKSSVFENDLFLKHVSKASKSNQISYTLSYELITSYLTDLIFEIDAIQSKTEKEARIRVYGYMLLEIGFMISFKNKKLFIYQHIKKEKK